MHALLLLAEGGEGSYTELLWLFYALMGFFVLTIIAGWLSSARTPEQTPAKVEAVSTPLESEVEIEEVEKVQRPSKGTRKKK